MLWKTQPKDIDLFTDYKCILFNFFFGCSTVQKFGVGKTFYMFLKEVSYINHACIYLHSLLQ